MIEFESDSGAFQSFNSQIFNVCSNVHNLLTDLVKKYPHLQKYDTHIIE